MANGPRITGSYIVQLKGESPEVFFYDGSFPEGFMEAASQFLGNGQQRMSAGFDIGILEYGSGVKASFNVSVACDAHPDAMKMAADFVSTQAFALAKRNFQIAEQHFFALLQERQLKMPYPVPAIPPELQSRQG